MGMEGINWEEVNSQSKTIIRYINGFRSDVIKRFQDFFDEMCYYWASGNAVTFGNAISGNIEAFYYDVKNIEEEISRLIEHAAEIYSTTFNVDNNINIGLETTIIRSSTLLSSPFQKVMYGKTGMNKNAVDECYKKLEANIQSCIDETRTNLNAIQLSIFDVANAQKIAFDDKIKSLFSSVESSLKVTINYIEICKKEEEDRIDLAKQQTVNTFSA